MSVKRVLPLAILLVGAAAIAIVWVTGPRVEAERPVPPLPRVEVQTVAPRPYRFEVSGYGSVKPRTETDLVPQVSGEVVWVSPALAPGGFFAAGEPLLRVEPIDYEAALESARAALARTESEERRARKELERQRRLADRSVASQARIDDAENAFAVAAAALREARAQLGRAERDLERTELVAPYDGRVRSESVDVGQFVSRGTAVARLYAVDYAEVRLPLPDRELRYLDLPLAYREDGEAATEAEPGPEVELRAEFAGTPHTWRGRVVRTEGEIDARSRMVTVVARVEDPYGRAAAGERPPLAVGLFVAATLQGRRIEQAVLLPREALHEEDRVLVLDAESRLHFRRVEVLRSERDRIVVGSGLEAGEQVCVSLLSNAVDGMAVRARPVPAELARVEHDEGESGR